MTAATTRVGISRWGDGPAPTGGAGKLAANAVIKRGYHCAYNSTGYLVPFTASNTLKSAGIALMDADNTGGADGAISIELSWGCHEQSIGTAGDALTDADISAAVYAIDNATIGKTSGSGARSFAGIFMGLNPETGRGRVIVGPLAFAIATAVLS